MNEIKCTDCNIKIIPPESPITDLFGRIHCPYCYELSQLSAEQRTEARKEIYLAGFSEGMIEAFREVNIEKLGKRKPCPHCDGNGTYTTAERQHKYGCWRCNRTGMLVAIICPDCDGTTQTYHQCGCKYCDQDYEFCENCVDGIYDSPYDPARDRQLLAYLLIN